MSDDKTEAYDALIQFIYLSPIGLLQTTLDGEITMINPMSAQLLMPLVPDGNLLNLFDALVVVAPELRALVAATNQNAAGTICDGFRFEVAAASGSADRAPKTLSLRLVKLDRQTLMATVSDVSAAVAREQQRIAVRLQDAARIDALTGLPNRSVAIERIAVALARAAADPDYLFAVLFIDCDRFDRINVSMGAQVGDELLRLVGSRLSGIVRLGDAADTASSSEPAAARISSDQFVLVVPAMHDASDASSVAQRVGTALAKPFSIGESLVHITASVGVFVRQQELGDAEATLQNADFAMHEAKRAGGARYAIFDPLMKVRAARLGTLESELRQAIAARQLFVVYQPIIAMEDGACVGVEALVRWRHPERGIVPPIDFICIAEATGLISALGEFVLIESCRQLAEWRLDLGDRAPSSISVNLSRAQLLGGGFTALVRQTLAASGLQPRHLQLEITESLAAQDAEVIAQLHQLKALGLTLALDDFGTGYSSLSSLHQFPVDVVKIDRSFVSQIEASAHHRVLIEATVMVARSLGMRTVAEGIETAGQFAALAELGCDKGQGYWLARPMEAAPASRWLAGNAAAEQRA